ncbi:MAG: DMT family transporter [Nitratireductor sp.]|nr:DMT family transporter [Nitratireductor sp.]
MNQTSDLTRLQPDLPPHESGALSTGGAGGLAFPLAFGALVAGSVAMGVSPVFVRFAEIGPFASAFWRVALALPILFLWAWIEARSQNRPLRMKWSMPILLSGLFFAGDLTFWHLAITHTTMANATLMSCLAPVWVLILSSTFIGEKVPARSFAGLAICIAGASLLIGSSYQIDPSRLIGDIYGIITSLFFGLYFLAIRVGRRSMGSGELTFAFTLITALALLVVALVSGNQFLPQTPAGYAALLSLGTISHAGGQGLLSVALGSLSAAFSSLVIFLEAVAAAFFGWAIFNETMGPLQIAGGIAILAGIWVARPARQA